MKNMQICKRFTVPVFTTRDTRRTGIQLFPLRIVCESIDYEQLRYDRQIILDWINPFAWGSMRRRARALVASAFQNHERHGTSIIWFLRDGTQTVRRRGSHTDAINLIYQARRTLRDHGPIIWRDE